jgi:hypothetical protein
LEEGLGEVKELGKEDKGECGNNWIGSLMRRRENAAYIRVHTSVGMEGSEYTRGSNMEQMGGGKLRIEELEKVGKGGWVRNFGT